MAARRAEGDHFFAGRLEDGPDDLGGNKAGDLDLEGQPGQFGKGRADLVRGLVAVQP